MSHEILMSLPFDPKRVLEYEWSGLGLAVTLKGGDSMIVAKDRVTDEIIKLVAPYIGPPPWA
jgi:hypothetical protein